MSSSKSPNLVHYIIFSTGYVETTSPGRLAFFDPEGHTSAFEAIESFAGMLYAHYKQDRGDSGQVKCYRSKECPLENVAYPYEHCHKCGKKNSVISFENMIFSIEESLESFGSMEGYGYDWTTDFYFQDVFSDYGRTSVLLVEPEINTLHYIMSFLARTDVHPSIKKRIDEIAQKREKPEKFWLNFS